MGGKKKGKKGKGDDKPKEEPKIIIPDFVPHELGPLPISVKVYHLNDLFISYSVFSCIVRGFFCLIYTVNSKSLPAKFL